MKALCASFGYAWQGLVFVVRTQRNMRIHVCAALLVVIIGLCSDLSRTDWLWLMLAITLVVSAELFNSALEYVCDVVMPEYHESIKRAKDIAAAAVLICACFALCVGVMVFIG
ncbi:MAG: diacylglycerol kinase family protein [Alphaproteobacteria bacterium]|nr:MAG: diacylglycerol kinase family protein [Alphaproteobacteria bacterium]